MPICNGFYARLTFTGYHFLYPGLLEPKRSRLRSLKSTFNAGNFIHGLSLSISSDFGANLLLKFVSQRKIVKKSIDRLRQLVNRNCYKLVWCSRSSKAIDLNANREPVYDFLLVINSNLNPISNHLWNRATYWLKIANFSYFLSLGALTQGDPFRISSEALRILKIKSSRQLKVKIWWS